MQPKKLSDQELTKIAKETLEKAKGLVSSTKWIQFGDSPCLKFRLQSEGRELIRGETKIAASVAQVQEFLNQEDIMKKLDPTMKDFKVLHYIEGSQLNIVVDRYQFGGDYIPDDRDFISLQAQAQVENSTYMFTRGVEFGEPEVKGVIRGFIHIAAIVLTPLDEKTCRMIYISDTDMKGTFDQKLQERLAEQNASFPAKIAKHMAK